MSSRDSTFLYTLLDDPLWFVAGVRPPLFALPVWVRAVGLAFPLTTSLAVLRGALLDGQTTSDPLGPLAGLAALCVLLFGAHRRRPAPARRMPSTPAACNCSG